jgi:large subunit ribosomal protein L35
MLLKNKRKPQKAPFAGPAASQLLRVPEQSCTGTSARKSRGRDRAPPLSGAPAEGQDAKRASARIPVRPVSELKDQSKMPKMKTKSGAKKRFKMTGTGKVVAAQAGKRHGMIKRTAKFIQKARGTGVLNDSDAKIVKKYMPYNR